MASNAILPPELRGSAARFRSLLARPHAVQERVLRDVLSHHAASEYGRHHDFPRISDYAQYRESVPVASYEALAPRVGRMARGESNVLVCDPVVAFEPTGGSSGGSKLVPYTQRALDAFRAALVPWLDDVYRAYPQLESGTAYWSVSPACRERLSTPGGVPIGLENDAAYFGENLARAILTTLSVPPALAAVRDLATWRHLTVSRLLADEKLALVSVWSPTFLMELLRYAIEDADAIVQTIATGRPCHPAASAHEALPPMRPDAARARCVAAALAEGFSGVSRVWPHLALISCWDQASSRVYADQLRTLFPHAAVQGKGLLATEGVVTIPLAGCRFPVLAIESGFYEFIGEDGTAHAADDLNDGAEYEVLLTNHSGLYRYAIGDRVRVRGFAGATPMLEFIGRSGTQSDLCGEKITEAFAASVLAPLGTGFAALAALAADDRGYVLLLDAAEVSAARAELLAARVDAALQANSQYAYARGLRQLAPLRPVRCSEPLRSWLAEGLSRGQRLGDIKPCALYAAPGWAQTFRAVA